MSGRRGASPCIRIRDREVGPAAPVYVVAELSANHDQDFERAVDLVYAAKEAGADAVKLQTYTADTMTIRSDKEHFVIGGGTLWDGQTLYDLYQNASTPWEWHPRLKAIADDLGIALFSTPFDTTALKFLEDLGVAVYKVSSFELVDLALIERIAATGKPMILSTGMASLAEIEEAVTAARGGGAAQIALLKCTSAYPAPPEEMNLLTVAHLAETFGVPVGISDHTTGIAVPVVAVALGACIVEKHFTLSRAVPTADAPFSLEPHEFKTMVEAIRVAEKAVGQVRYGPSAQEERSRVFRRSLFVVRRVKAGEAFTAESVRSIRPGTGMAPKFLRRVLGRKAAVDLEPGTPLEWSHVAAGDD